MPSTNDRDLGSDPVTGLSPRDLIRIADKVLLFVYLTVI